MKNIFLSTLLTFLLSNPIFTCSPIPNFNYATLKEQTDYASAIIHGKVTKIIGGDQINDATVILSVNSYLKGCGEKEVVVSGFQGSSLCGSGIPDIGEELVVYVCSANFIIPNSEYNCLQKWSLNTFSLFTGVSFVKYNSEIVKKVKDLAGTDQDYYSRRNEFEQCGMEMCKSRPKSIPNIIDETFPNDNDDIFINGSNESEESSNDSEDKSLLGFRVVPFVETTDFEEH
jgi:hypothetical protein